MVDFEALRARVGEAVQSSLDIFEDALDELRTGADTLVDKVFDELEKIVEQAKPAAPQEPKETSNATHANWKMREPYVAPETGGRSKEDSSNIEKMYKYIVEHGPINVRLRVKGWDLDHWMNNPELDNLLKIHYVSAVAYNKDKMEWNGQIE